MTCESLHTHISILLNVMELSIRSCFRRIHTHLWWFQTGLRRISHGLRNELQRGLNTRAFNPLAFLLAQERNFPNVKQTRWCERRSKFTSRIRQNSLRNPWALRRVCARILAQFGEAEILARKLVMIEALTPTTNAGLAPPASPAWPGYDRAHRALAHPSPDPRAVLARS